MQTLAAGLDYVDLNFLGAPEIIVTAALQRKGIGVGDVHQILLTHIHLDHAGVTGTLVRENPAIEVFVHERGAPHLIDPSKLMASAGRLYGADMERLWGDFVPVPAGRVRALKGGEHIVAGGRELEVAYTPGHASHHVSYFAAASRVAFVGDTAGIRRTGRDYIMPPTPPPDIDLDAWRTSEDRILSWEPDTLFLTHFGPFHGARVHFQEMFARLVVWSALVRWLVGDTSLDEEGRMQTVVKEALLDL